MTDLAERRGVETELYEPAEDSALLAGAAVDGVDAEDRVLDVGTGSGYVAARVRAETGAHVVGSDVNPHACRRAAEAGVETVRADLVSPFRAAVFDVVTFNPPYLPADEDAARDDWVEVALTGGTSGRAVVDPFLDKVGRVLRPDGTVFLLVSSLTGIEAVVQRAGERGFSSVVVAETSFPYETLVVLKLVR
ncbi:HemK2/MTQ2 family protein methyltransferase [Halanaeroarchaeum sulfurireducens]|uniref:Methyltransferase n=1 Tax=Halanaeroarchaeum sulfurireducens TaxID=1604004 RepID=A0A0F7PDA5_9EURY|nr:HemK2/MTQ2 family protein methyltransferase [Halanaeroarchaeum sulfurireducens]AKH98140.1 methyltransferase [Halanaeroarchaeum sulfurireducens]ALG82534.1 methyltransferase [Halanaeroarchaeum sulfurireducens]